MSRILAEYDVDEDKVLSHTEALALLRDVWRLVVASRCGHVWMSAREGLIVTSIDGGEISGPGDCKIVRGDRPNPVSFSLPSLPPQGCRLVEPAHAPE